MIPDPIRDIAEQLNCDLSDFENDMPLDKEELIAFLRHWLGEIRSEELFEIYERYERIEATIGRFEHDEYLSE